MPLPPPPLSGTAWQVRAAPQPQDVVWANLVPGTWERRVRQQLGMLFFILLTVFFYLPVSFFASITSIDTLTRIFPGLSNLSTS